MEENLWNSRWERLRAVLKRKYFILSISLFYLDVISDAFSIKEMYEFKAIYNVGYMCLSILVERIVQVFLVNYSFQHVYPRRFTKLPQYLFSFLIVFFYLDPIFFFFGKRNKNFLVQRKLEKIQKIAMFTEAIIESNISIICTAVMIYQKRILRNIYSFEWVEVTLFISLINLSTRITQQYIRRVRSARNYKYDKSVVKYSDLTEQEKDIIFYPKMTVYILVELLRPYETNKVYNLHVRSRVRLSALNIAWIWTIIFINSSAASLAYGFLSIVYVLPNYGIIPRKQLRPDENMYLIFPTNFQIFVLFLIITRWIPQIAFSRFHILKIVCKSKTFLGKLGLILVQIISSNLDYNFIMREQPPLQQIFDPEQHIKQNWLDNQEPQNFIIFFRMIVEMVGILLGRILVPRFFEYNEQQQKKFENITVILMAQTFFAIQAIIYLAHFFLNFKNKFLKNNNQLNKENTKTQSNKTPLENICALESDEIKDSIEMGISFKQNDVQQIKSSVFNSPRLSPRHNLIEKINSKILKQKNQDFKIEIKKSIE